MSQSALERVRVIGPLAGFADGYRAHLVEQGYSLSGARDQFYLLVHASRWLGAEGLDLVALTSPVMLRRYVVWRREQGAVFLSSRQNGRIFQPNAECCGGAGW